MTKITTLAFNRKFVKGSEKGKYSDMEPREKVIPSFTKKIGMCYICNKPVMSAPGQILNKTDNGLYSHKACRKK